MFQQHLDHHLEIRERDRRNQHAGNAGDAAPERPRRQPDRGTLIPVSSAARRFMLAARIAVPSRVCSKKT
jgi:hypothetical protein